MYCAKTRKGPVNLSVDKDLRSRTALPLTKGFTCYRADISFRKKTGNYQQSGKISRIWPWRILISTYTCNPGEFFFYNSFLTCPWVHSRLICIYLHSKGKKKRKLRNKCQCSKPTTELLICFALCYEHKTCFESDLKRGQRCEQSQMLRCAFRSSRQFEITLRSNFFGNQQ